MTILVAPNSFRECADSVEISEIICEKLQTNSSFKIVSKPLSDGGDGFLNVCKLIFQTEPLIIKIVNDLDSSVKEYTVQIDHRNKNVFIESAELFGLKSFNESKRNPLNQNSKVMGKILAKLAEDVSSKKLDVQTVWIGVGGTATIDFGIGACTYLGVELYDELDKLIPPEPINFHQVKKIEFNNPELPFEIKCVVDVETPLIGEPGAIEIYGMQKGATEDDLKIIKSGIKNLLSLITAEEKLSLPKKLNGAGGGLAAGLNIFLGAEIIPAEKFIKSDLLKDIILEEIDVVITGEGSFDFQSFEGKGSGVILKLFKDKSIPVFLINGSTILQNKFVFPKNIRIINTIDFFKSKTQSIQNFRSGIEKATEIVLNELNN